MTFQRIPSVFSLIAILTATASVEAQITPKFSGQLWADAFYEDRFGETESGFRLKRGVLGMQAEVAPSWSVQFSYIADPSAALLQDGFVQYRSSEEQGLKFQMGRVKLPYFEYMEQSFVERWADLFSQAEQSIGGSSVFSSYRDEGLRASYVLSDAFEVSAMLRNGLASDSVDADFGWNAAALYRFSDGVQLQVSADQQSRSEPSDAAAGEAQTRFHASLGTRNNKLASVFEFNSRNKVRGFAVSSVYSFDGTLGQSTDWGLLASLFTGNAVYKTEAQNSLRLSVGAYKRLSANLRTALNIFNYSKVDNVAQSAGNIVRWSWEATF